MKLKRVLFGKVSIVKALGIWGMCFLSAYFIVWFWTDPNAKALFGMKYWKSVFRYGESMRLVHAKYFDRNQSDFEKLTDSAISGMVNDLDRHSSFFSPDKYKIFQDGMHRRYVGVGIIIRKFESGILITKVFADGPADKSGLAGGDLILEIDGKPVKHNLPSNVKRIVFAHYKNIFGQTVYKFYGKYEVDWDKTNEYFQTFKRVTKEVDLKKYKS